MLKNHGVQWEDEHLGSALVAPCVVAVIAAFALWGYGWFVFLPNFKVTCSPLQRDAYFATVEAIHHGENVDGIGDDAL